MCCGWRDLCWQQGLECICITSAVSPLDIDLAPQFPGVLTHPWCCALHHSSVMACGRGKGVARKGFRAAHPQSIGISAHLLVRSRLHVCPRRSTRAYLSLPHAVRLAFHPMRNMQLVLEGCAPEQLKSISSKTWCKRMCLSCFIMTCRTLHISEVTSWPCGINRP